MMRRSLPYLLLTLLLAPFASCERLDIKPTTKVETGEPTPINALSASVAGRIIDLSGGANDDHGFCYATHPNPTVSDGKVSLGKPTVGTIEANIEGLNPGSTVHIRAYCMDEEGPVYGEVFTITMPDGVATVITTEPSNISAFSATSGGTISDDGGAPITARGVVWSTSPNPTTSDSTSIDGAGTGEFSSSIAGLLKNTKYYLRAYATNIVGTHYGDQISFTTPDGLISIATQEVTGIRISSAVSGGSISSDGGADVTDRGVVWSTSRNPTTNNNQGSTSNGTGTDTFTSNIAGLSPVTTYFVRAYATNSIGTSYGNEQTFTTPDGSIILSTTAATSIRISSAVIGGSISSDGGLPITDRGVVWSTSQNPTTTNNQGITSNGTGTGDFLSYITSLSPETTYYFRAYATNSMGTSYGNEQTFTTPDGSIILSTTEATLIRATSAVSGGSISSDGGLPITDRGVVWSTSQNPTTTNYQGITSNGTGTDPFTSNITGLSPETTYYVRAYATNVFGAHYGNQVSFTTPVPDVPGATITDADGNTYNTIWINGRQWMKENLRTTKYNEGTNITHVNDSAYWCELGIPAYCWYNNDIANKPIYGALYNWYAVNTGNLCPTGWHVPTDAEWTALTDYVGSDPSTKLKATIGWDSGGNGSDEFGFSALPGGDIYCSNGVFCSAGYSGYWWSSTERNVETAWLLSLYVDAIRGTVDKRDGVSIRCIKDN